MEAQKGQSPGLAHPAVCESYVMPFRRQTSVRLIPRNLLLDQSLTLLPAQEFSGADFGEGFDSARIAWARL